MSSACIPVGPPSQAQTGRCRPVVEQVETARAAGNLSSSAALTGPTAVRDLDASRRAAQAPVFSDLF